MSGECDDELDIDSKGGTLPTKVVKYEQFLNDTLRGDLKYVNRGSMYGIFRNRPESPVSRAEVTGRLSLPDATSAHAREMVGNLGPQ